MSTPLPCPANYESLRATVFGLGSFGGGVGAVKFLVAQGAQVTVTDIKPASELTESLAQLSNLAGVHYQLGGHREADILDADLLVVSPAVPRSNEFLLLAARRGIPITSEMNLFWKHNRGRIAGVTGSNGKSTTTALLHAIVSTNPQRRCWLGGNIGHSLLPDVDQIRPEDWVILELSSFQLEDLAREFTAPAPATLSIVTNFSPNHLDRHGTIDAYRHAKQTLLQTQTESGIAILNGDDPDVRDWPTRARRRWFSWNDSGRPGIYAASTGAAQSRSAILRNELGETHIPVGDWLRLPGRHNFENALAATCAALAIGATLHELESGIRNFHGLPHRLEFVAEKAGRRFYNDSKATTPAAACLALSAFDTPIVLLAGGYDKQLDMSALADRIVSLNLRGVVLLGQTAPELDRLLNERLPTNRIPRAITASFPDACNWAASISQPGDVVLLSPGCASYDWFANYEARGAAFQQWVSQWPGPPDSST